MIEWMSGRTGLEEHCEADTEGKGQTACNGSGQGPTLSRVYGRCDGGNGYDDARITGYGG